MRKKESKKKENYPRKAITQQRIIQAAEKRNIRQYHASLSCLIQLGNVQLDDQNKLTEAIGETSLLIGKAVKDLRNG